MSLTDAARILYGSPLSRPKNAIVAIIVLVVLLLVSMFSLFRNYFSTLSPGAVQVYLIGLLASLLVILIPLAILWFLDRREPESRWLYLIAVLWGAVIASGMAIPIKKTRWLLPGERRWGTCEIGKQRSCPETEPCTSVAAKSLMTLNNHCT